MSGIAGHRAPSIDICIIDRCLVLVINPILIVNILEYLNDSFIRLRQHLRLVFYQSEDKPSAYPASLESKQSLELIATNVRYQYEGDR